MKFSAWPGGGGDLNSNNSIGKQGNVIWSYDKMESVKDEPVHKSGRQEGDFGLEEKSRL